MSKLFFDSWEKYYQDMCHHYIGLYPYDFFSKDFWVKNAIKNECV